MYVGFILNDFLLLYSITDGFIHFIYLFIRLCECAFAELERTVK